MKKGKLKSIAKIKKELLKLWSKRVRERDKKCVLCGEREKQLYAHHYIVNSARSVKYRYDLRNGVSLCYACHRYKVHKTASWAVIHKLVNYAVLNGIVSATEVAEIAADGCDKDLSKDRGYLEACRISLQD